MRSEGLNGVGGLSWCRAVNLPCIKNVSVKRKGKMKTLLSISVMSVILAVVIFSIFYVLTETALGDCIANHW
jgi:hypothetical protein